MKEFYKFDKGATMKTILISFLSIFVLFHSSQTLEGGERFEEKESHSTKWAFIIGIDEYMEEGFFPLPNASNYGREIAKILKQTYGYQDENVIELYNQDATDGAIYERLAQLAEIVGYNDTFFAYFLVHDIVTKEGYFLVPYNGKIGQPWRTFISIDRFQKFFLNLRARQMFTVVAGCSELPPFYEKRLRGLEYESDNFNMLAYNCTGMANEMDGMQLFNEYFIAVMKGEGNVADRRGKISADRIFDFLEKKLRAEGISLLKFSNQYGENFVFVPQFDERVIFLNEQLNKGNSPRQRINAITEMVELIRTSDEAKKAEITPQVAEMILEISQDNGDDLNVRRRAVEALGQLRFREAIPGLINLFDGTPEFTLKSSVLEALVQIDTDEVIPFLRETLHHQEPDFRITAIRALIQFDNREALSEILELLQNDDNIDVRITILKLIDRFEPITIDARNIIMRSLKDPKPSVRKEAVNALGNLGESRATEEILRLLRTDDDPNVRESAAYSLVRLTNDENRSSIVEGLISALKKDDASIVREAAAFSVGKVGGEDAEKPLINIVKDKKESDYVVRTAAQALGNLGSRKAVYELIKLLHRNDPEIRRAAAQSLGKIGDDRAINPLIQRLKLEKIGYVKEEVSKALENISTPQKPLNDQRELLSELNDPSPIVRGETIDKIAELNDSEVVPRLVEKLADHDYSVRQKAIRNLTNYRDDASIEIYLDALRDENFLKRQGAIKILGYIGMNEFIDVLLRYRDDPSNDVRAEVFKSLGKMKDDGLLEVFFAGFEDRDMIVREAAAEGLANQIIRFYLENKGNQIPEIVTEAFRKSERTLGPDHPWTRWFNILAIENPEPSLEVEFVMNRLTEMESIQEEQHIGVLFMNEGESFECILKNHSNTNLNFIIFDLSLEGNVSQFYPREGGTASMAPGSTWNNIFEAFVPDGMEGAKDIIKVFLSTEPFYFDKSPSRRNLKYQRVFVKKDIFSRLLASVGKDRIEIDPQSWITLEKVLIVKRGEKEF